MQSVRLIWHGLLVHKLVDEAAEEGAELAAMGVLEDANNHVPLKDGILQASGTVSSDSGDTFVSYDTGYAVRLHEHPEYNFRGQGEGKWLEHAIQRAEHRVHYDMAPPLVRLFRRDALGRFTR